MSFGCLGWWCLLGSGFWLLGCNIVVAEAPPLDSSAASLAIEASSGFQMAMRPTRHELDFTSLARTAEAMEEALLLFAVQAGIGLVDVNVNIEEMEWQESTDTGDLNQLSLPTTLFRFFAVGTSLEGSAQEDDVVLSSLLLLSAPSLDDTITAAFSVDHVGAFVDLLRNSENAKLQSIRDITLFPPPKVDHEFLTDDSVLNDDFRSFPSNFTLLDVVLTTVSASIFLGIAYMICQHHTDRGYIENQRLRNLRTLRYVTSVDSSSSQIRWSNEEQPLSFGNYSHASKSAESGMSTALANNYSPKHSTVYNVADSIVKEFSFPVLEKRQPKVKVSVITLNSPVADGNTAAVAAAVDTAATRDTRTPKSTSSVFSFGDTDEQSTNSIVLGEFGANWFRSSKIPPETKEEVDDEEGVKSTSSGESDRSAMGHVFHVGFSGVVGRAATSVMSNSFVADDSISRASSVISDWLKTIQVVSSSEAKTNGTSEVTSKDSSTPEHSSTAPSLGIASDSSDDSLSSSSDDDHDEDSTQIDSLEQSLASSFVEDVTPKADNNRTNCMEV